MKMRCWNAGDAGCGTLAMGLRRGIDMLEAGDRLQVTAHNAGAAADVPAWCRITGHALEVAEHPIYVICKKDH